MATSLVLSLICGIVGIYIVNKLSGNVIFSKLDKLLGYLITNYRPVFAFFILLPLSFIADLIFSLITKYNMRKTLSDKTESRSLHQSKILKIQKQIKYWNKNIREKQSQKQKLCTARAGWKTMSLRVGKYKSSQEYYQIDLNDLNCIVDINLENETVFVEPNVTMGQLSASLLPLGYSIPVLPELDDLTVGGLICGMGIESTSHVYGLFQYICISYQVVLDNGEIVECSARSKELRLRRLFYCLPMSYGTLGMLLGCTIKIIPVKSHVALEYIPTFSKQDAINVFTKESISGEYDFVEGLAYGHDRYVIMRGKYSQLSENDKSLQNAIGLWYKPWFYKHVESFLLKSQNLSKSERKKVQYIEYIPLRDYYHRHTKSLFWEVEDIMPFGNNVIFRYLFGWLMPLNVSLLKRTQTKEIKRLYEEHHVVQDMLVPMDTLDASLSVIEQEFDVYPLWMCPMKIFANESKIEGFVYPKLSSVGKNSNNVNLRDHEKKEVERHDGYDYSSMYVDIGIYGNPKSAKFEAKRCLRTVEKFVRDCNGYQMLYADTYMTRSEFREMYHHNGYDQLRKELGCQTVFPEVFDKVSKKARE